MESPTRRGIGGRSYPHPLRRTFAINSLRQGGGECAVQGILGHSTVEMTRRHCYLRFDDLAEAHRRPSPAFIKSLSIYSTSGARMKDGNLEIRVAPFWSFVKRVAFRIVRDQINHKKSAPWLTLNS